MSRIELPEGVAIDDPRPIAASAPHTFFLPHPEELAAPSPGDGIKEFFARPREARDMMRSKCGY